MISITFVCLGNICRSPTAEGVFAHIAKTQGLEKHFHIESAGTSSYHVGEPPHPSTCAAALRKGIALNHRSQQFKAKDFARFDYVIALDNSNLNDLKRLTTDPTSLSKLSLLRNFDPQSPRNADMPDPYYQGGFDGVVELCWAACEGLLSHIRQQHNL
jgi:protein-tyrosine phosphatase